MYVCREISSSSKSSLWAAITKTATVWCFLLFYTQIMQSIFLLCLFCGFVLKAIYRYAFIKMLFCDKCFSRYTYVHCTMYIHTYMNSTYPCPSVPYHHHLLYLFFSSHFCFVFVICAGWKWLPALKFSHCAIV